MPPQIVLQAEYLTLRKSKNKEFTVIVPKDIADPDSMIGKKMWLIDPKNIKIIVDTDDAPLIQPVRAIGKDAVLRSVFKIPKDKIGKEFLAVIPID